MAGARLLALLDDIATVLDDIAVMTQRVARKTAALFLVGGGILVHGLPGARDLLQHVTHGAAAVPVIGPLLDGLAMPLCNALVGLLAGAILLGVATSISRVNRPSGGRNAKERGAI